MAGCFLKFLIEVKSILAGRNRLRFFQEILFTIMRTILLVLAVLLTAMTPALTAGETGNQLKAFLLSTPNTYGWTPVKGGKSYDFFPDGRLHVQGSDGEASMWQGKWKLDGNRLTVVIPELDVNKVVTASADGKELVLDGVRYRRVE